MKAASHISFFQGFILVWRMKTDRATKAAIKEFERLLDAAAILAGEKPWEQARDEALAALAFRQWELLTEMPSLVLRAKP